MRCAYQITRQATPGVGYTFQLVRFSNGKIVSRLTKATGRSPIAPQWLRDAQARLNTKAELD